MMSFLWTRLIATQRFGEPFDAATAGSTSSRCERGRPRAGPESACAKILVYVGTVDADVLPRISDQGR